MHSCIRALKSFDILMHYLSDVNFAISVVVIGLQKALFELCKHRIRDHLHKWKMNRISTSPKEKIFYLGSTFWGVDRGHKFSEETVQFSALNETITYKWRCF